MEVQVIYGIDRFISEKQTPGVDWREDWVGLK